MIQKNFVDMENMLELLKENREVDDLPGAPNLLVRDGAVQFQNVSFRYVLHCKKPCGAHYRVDCPNQWTSLSYVLHILIQHKTIRQESLNRISVQGLNSP